MAPLHDNSFGAGVGERAEKRPSAQSRDDPRTSFVERPRRSSIFSLRSIGPPATWSTSAATTVIGPPVSMIAAKRFGAPGAATPTTARSAGCGLRPCPSPKSVSLYCQALAKPASHRLVRCRGAHHFDLAEIGAGEHIEQLGQRRGIAAHMIRRVDGDPATGPWPQIKRANHERSVPGTCDTVRRLAMNELPPPAQKTQRRTTPTSTSPNDRSSWKSTILGRARVHVAHDGGDG